MEFRVFGDVANPDQRLSTLSLLTDAEQHQVLVEWNNTKADYPEDKYIHKLFEAQVERTPDAVAVVFEDAHLTYRELNQRANQLAHHLRELGVGPEVLVGICLERSLEMVLGLLGILKAGGVYVPLDPAYPKERLAFMLEDAQVPVLLTQERVLGELPEHRAHMVCLDAGWKVIERGSETNPSSEVTIDNLAYVIYTSGSTGRPKGVMISHRALVNHMCWMQMAFPLTEADHVLQKTPFSFDASVWEFFAALLAGARLIMAQPGGHGDSAYLVKLLAEQRVTVLQLVPSMLQVFLEEGGLEACTALRHVFCGGEALPVQLQERFFARLSASLHNLYGPTEATIDATLWTCKREDHERIIPIGRPIANTQIYLLDAHLQPVPIGVPGELYISGIGLGRGYLDHPELTAEKFIPNPFSTDPGARLYKSNDLARYRPDGNIEFLGRLDQQVKLRGFRIELGEIEATLTQHPAVREVVVLAREDIPSAKRLVAYVVANQPSPLSITELRKFLQEKLPSYMVPSAFMQLAALPLMPNGKMDRQALPAPDQAQSELESSFVAPRTPMEEVLAGIWAQLLGLERVGIHDNFFALGGHSLLATQFIARVREAFHVELSQRSIFETPTMAGIAKLIEKESHLEQSLHFPPMRPIPRDRDLPLSLSQEGVRFIQQLDPENMAYNFQATLRFKGLLDVGALQRSLGEIVRRHEIYRTTFPVINGRPIQVIHQAQPVNLPAVNLQALPESERESEAQRLTSEEFQKPFNLLQLPLIRWTLLQLSPREYVLVHVEHHLVHDGWSFNVFLRELLELYQAFLLGNPSPLPELPIQFADFAYWQRQWMQEGVAETQLAYWKQKLAGSPPVMELPYDRQRPAAQSFQGASSRVELPVSLCQSLRALSRQEGVTLFMTMLAAYLVLLHRYTGQGDLRVGSGIANRRWRETEGLIGMIINTVVLRTDLSGNPTFRELLDRVREVTLEAYAHQDLPFDQVVAALQPARDLSHNPLFQVMFGFHDAPLPDLSLPGITINLLEGLSNGSAKFDMNITIIPRSEQRVGLNPRAGTDGITIIWEYNSDLFDAATITRMVGHYQTLLAAIIANPAQRLSTLPILTEVERDQLLVEWNATQTDYPKNSCICQLFEAQVERTPNAIAVAFEGEQLTYRELNARANQLAHYLRTRGVGPEVLVGICMERSLEMLVGIYAILKAGGAYVPLDPEYPKERLAFMLQDAQVPILLTQKRLIPQLPLHHAQMVCVDVDWATIARESRDNPISGVTATNLAYVIYTSGSTGRPKGVLNTHRGICNRLLWMQEAYQLTEADRVLHKTPLSFDVSVWELFWSLLVGARLVVAQPGGHRDNAYLVNLIVTQGITTGHFVPSMLQRFLEEQDVQRCHSLRRVICSGEALPYELQERFLARLPKVVLHNLYGPTEAAVDVTSWACRPQSMLPVVPIGCPVANTQVYILDPHLQPVPIRVPGELHIGGVQVARGYLNRPELTAEKFIPDPFSTNPGSRLYKTGDLARYWPDGNIEFLARIDHQVKIRGFRIEPGEIEAVLGQHPGVRETVVTMREDAPGDKRLVAYIVPRQGHDPTTSALQHFLRERLPEHMVPAVFVPLQAMPLTPNGKVDRQALPAPGSLRPELEGAFVAPRTLVEEILAGIWCQVLGLEQVGIHDNFFDLGGHSLLATQVIARLQAAFQVELPLRHVFEMPTIAEFAQAVEKAKDHGAEFQAPAMTPLSREAYGMKRSALGETAGRGHEEVFAFPLSFAQQRLWLLDQLEPGSSIYNTAHVFRLHGPLDTTALTQSLNELVRRHEVLRTTFSVVQEQPVQIIASHLSIQLPVVNLCRFPEAARDTECQRLVAQECQRPFDLSQGPLIRTLLLQLGEEDHVWLLTMHHIVTDHWNMDILYSELCTLYGAFTAGTPSPLPDLPIQYADFAVWQRQWLQGEVLETQLAYWRQQLAGAPAAAELPTDYPRPPVQTHRGAMHVTVLPNTLAQSLAALGQEEGTTLFMTLLAAFKVLLQRLTGQDDIGVGAPIAGRTHFEVEGLVGCFLNTLVLRTTLSGNPSFRELLRRVRGVTLDAYSHQDVPFEQLLEQLQVQRDLSRTPLFQIFVNMFSSEEAQLALTGLTVEPLQLVEPIALFDVTLYIRKQQGNTLLKLVYNRDLFRPERMAEMLEQFQHLLWQVVKYPDHQLASFSLVTATAQKLLPDPTQPFRVDWQGPVHTTFSQHVQRHPEHLAVVDAQEQWTYADLEARSNQLAHYLLASGLRSQDVVAIYAHRSSALVWALLGVLKAGGAFMILDPAYPSSRLIKCLRLAKPQAWLQLGAAGALPETLEEFVATLSCRCRLELPQRPTANTSGLLADYLTDDPRVTIGPDDLAYVAFTSGSTGQPKGILGSHRPISHFLTWYSRTFELTESDRFSMLSGLSHDPLLRDIFTPLWLGATLYIPEMEDIHAPGRLTEWMGQRELSVMHLTPALGQLLTETSSGATIPRGHEPGLNSLRYACFGGDVLSQHDVSRLRALASAVTCVNFYGTTETPQAMGYFVVPNDDAAAQSHGSTPDRFSDRVPLGHGIQDVQLLVLNNSRQLAGIGEVGEIYVRTPYLTKGYIEDEPLTQERFMINPFTKILDDRLYRTGDLARYLPNGDVVFLGRIDEQVKVRGFRIELGEIETVLGQHEAVREAVVVAREEPSGDRQLVAYLVPHLAPASTIQELRHFLRQRLPDYMVPTVFVFLDALPLIPNGKVDRRALPLPDQWSPLVGRTFVAPRTPVEEVLAGIWAEVLGLEHVGIYDNFFDLGGHSLKATQVMSRVRRAFDMELALCRFFETPTVAGLASAIDYSQVQKEGSDDLASILEDLEQLSDDEVKKQLREREEGIV